MSHALDPLKSVVVEACAGSGKTWALASRLIRLLLAGVPPSRILAITYTRKAAAEIEARLAQWLRDLAVKDDHAVIEFLAERGMTKSEAEAALPRARGLYEAVLLAEQPPTITTFHGWFVRLLSAAPINSPHAGRSLVQAAQPLMDEAWASLARRAAAKGEDTLAQALLNLFASIGMHSSKNLLTSFINRRAEWQAYDHDVDTALAHLRDVLQVEDTPVALQRFFAQPGLAEDLREFLALLIKEEGVKELARSEQLAASFEMEDLAARFATLRQAFLTKEHQPLVRKPSDAMTKRQGRAGAERFIELHHQLSAWCVALHGALQEEATYALNRAGLTAGVALLAALEDWKSAHRLMDFTDLETLADALLSGEDSAFLQARLDARYQHILLDEFQDTNPLQWRILRAWFDAYGPGQERPRVFMVGDPKQSIYRFRRAEPRIFGAAASYLQTHFNAERIEMDTTRRNAPAVVEVVNALFSAQSAFEGFRPQQAFHTQLPGRVAVWPLIDRNSSEATSGDAMLRDPLTEPQRHDEDNRRTDEALMIASQLSQWVGRLAVHE
ncbi:MAG: hypothetical protein RIR70_1683, partial [Pseudomonadota bacterium]